MENGVVSLRLTLVAHAATRATREAAFPSDEPLEPLGATKAAAMAASLGRVDEARTSPARRAVQTAAALGLDAAVDPALADLDLRRGAGRSLADIETSDADGLRRWASDPAAAPHGGESIESLLRRVADWLDEMARREGRLLAVTHAAIIRAAIVVALDAHPRTFWRIDVEPLAVAVLRKCRGDWTLRLSAPGRLTPRD